MARHILQRRLPLSVGFYVADGFRYAFKIVVHHHDSQNLSLVHCLVGGAASRRTFLHDTPAAHTCTRLRSTFLHASPRTFLRGGDAAPPICRLQSYKEWRECESRFLLTFVHSHLRPCAIDSFSWNWLLTFLAARRDSVWQLSHNCVTTVLLLCDGCSIVV